MKKRFTAQRKKQIAAGIGILIICAIVMLVAANGKSVEDRDITPVLLLAPMGIYLIFTKREMR